MAAAIRCMRFQSALGAFPSRFSQRANYSAVNGARVTQLQNGARVVSVDNGAPTSAVGVIVNAGPRFETHDTLGSAAFLQQMAYKSTESLSALRLTRLIEATTHSFAAQSSRAGLSFNAEVLRSNVSDTVALLGEVLRPRLPEWEVRDQREVIASSVSKSSDELLDLVHHVAFRGQGLGNPTGIPAWNLANLSHEALQAYVARFYTGNNVALVGVDVDHDELVKAAEDAIGSLPAGEKAAAPASPYHGGEMLVRTGGPTQVAIGFEALPWGSQGADTEHILMRLLGGNTDARRTPGTGVTSRLAQLQEQNGAVRSAGYFHCAFNGAGIAGMKAVAAPGQANAVGDALMGVLTGVATEVSQEEADRALAALKRDACSFFERRSNQLQYLQFESVHGDSSVRDPMAFTTSPAELQKAAQRLLESAGSAVVMGDISGVGSA